MSDFATKQEFDQLKRFIIESNSNMAKKVLQIEQTSGSAQPGIGLSKGAKDMLAKQVDMFYKKLLYLETELKKIKQKLGIKDE